MDLFYEIRWECSADGMKYNKMVEKERVFDFLHCLNSNLDEEEGYLRQSLFIYKRGLCKSKKRRK